jgi:succinate-acetate transporter protein
MTQRLEAPAQSTGGASLPDPRPPTDAVPDVVPAAADEAPPVGDPGMVALPAFLVGSVALGLVLVGFVPATAGGAAIPIIMTATGIGLLIGAVWAARLAQSAVAGVFGVFAGFWLSYAALVLGLTHGWFGIAAADATRSVELFLICWLVVLGLLTLSSVRLPMAFTVLFALVELALLLDLLGTVNASTALVKAAGWVVFAFVVVGAYLYLSGMAAATGGRSYPLGRPTVR